MGYLGDQRGRGEITGYKIVDGEPSAHFVFDFRTSKQVNRVGSTDLTDRTLRATFPRSAIDDLGPKWKWQASLAIDGDDKSERPWYSESRVADETDGHSGVRVPEDVLLYGALCEALLDYTLSVILGGDDFSRHLIEAQFVSPAQRDRKLDVLNAVMRRYCPEVYDASPYDTLVAELRRLFDYRDKIAHSQPNRGDRYHRLRRRHGVNEHVSVTEEELTAELDRGMSCHSALDGLPYYVSVRRSWG